MADQKDRLEHGEGSIRTRTTIGRNGKERTTHYGVFRRGGIRRSVSSTNRQTVRRALVRFNVDYERGHLEAADPTLGELVDDWLEKVGAAKSPRTREHDRWALDQLGSAICAKRVSGLRPRDVDRELERLRDRPYRSTAGKKRSEQRPARGWGKGPLGHSSLKKVRRALAEVLTEAERDGIVLRNVARLARLPVDATEARSRRSLTEEQTSALIEATWDHRWHALFVLGLRYGPRPGEVTGLPWDALDLDAGTLTIRQALQRRPDGGLVVGPTKAKSDRVLRLSPGVAKTLKAHQKRQATERLAAPVWDDHGLVFTNEIGRPIDQANLRRTLRALCVKAKVPTISPNEMRHTAASLLIAAGVPLEEVADVLGHRDVTVLARYYRHRVKRVVDVVGAVERLAGDTSA